MHENQLQLSEVRTNQARTLRVFDYTITLAPGVVRYLGVANFLDADVERSVDLVRSSSAQPKIQIPRDEFVVETDQFNPGLNLEEIDELFPNIGWEERLRIHHALGRAYKEHGMPSCVYGCFHRELKLTELTTAACLDAWVKKAWHDNDLTESFTGVSDYMVLTSNAYSSRCVFRKTHLIVHRLGELEREAEGKKRREQEAIASRATLGELERLRKSSFSTFVYLMEDLRNGHFKIGRSATPGKRERTLQSEVPQIVLRFSIPANVDHERELHERFDDKRQRGEWFALSPDDLLWLMSFLKQHGDGARVAVDHQWFTNIFFNGAGQP